MENDILLSISGVQDAAGSTEIITAGHYYFRNGKHYLTYEEESDTGKVTRNVIKIARDRVDVIRSGENRSRILFEKGEKSLADYPTPVGSMALDISTEDIDVEESVDRIEAEIRYSLAMEGVFISDCRVKIRAMEKEGADLDLLARKDNEAGSPAGRNA